MYEAQDMSSGKDYALKVRGMCLFLIKKRLFLRLTVIKFKFSLDYLLHCLLGNWFCMLAGLSVFLNETLNHKHKLCFTKKSHRSPEMP